CPMRRVRAYRHLKSLTCGPHARRLSTPIIQTDRIPASCIYSDYSEYPVCRPLLSKLGGSHLRWRLKRLRRRISTSSRRLWRPPRQAWSSVAPIYPNKALRVRAAFFCLLCFWWPKLRPTHRSRSPARAEVRARQNFDESNARPLKL